ncbi:alpha-tubulin N-acetyltransferase [Solenopsis invicta]|uniref:alpha-tubulin N-acetyltransferase n=1 Tax=Solenopsis invicta TaxID=13686 RepID=UPI000E33F605|nr:alpha-tubulin N-acetyltransferase [Solenopsis invicta]XP_039309539.1 alpha-tubulin N-acetyltransferase [Solenopsis invicta]XP_039309540.1 alpha-tubulin N-acetyltransferase [Solenopsis invicta]
MEFKFNVNKLLPRKINKVTHNLLPEDFKGDRRELNECQRLLSRILDDMGEASARAQGLNKPITSALKLRDTDHTIYLLVDNEANKGLGSVVGLLKTGSKNLFLFDETGEHYQLQARCILDFYVHESRQRMGLGNILYQHMLSEENIRPVKLAIDRPSEKFLAFLRKYYGLLKIIPQNNKFVVFEGFFDDESRDVRSNRYSLPPRMSLDDGVPSNNDNNGRNGASLNGVPYVASVPRSSFGRYAAARPPCSMANIIHNTAMLGQSAEHTGNGNSVSPPPTQEENKKLERPRSLSLYSEEEQKQRSLEMNTVPTPIVPDNQTKPFVPVLLDAEKTEKNVKPPSCSQEVATGTNQHGHLDLKFYHSPLW